jgi:hypothetical protein
MEAAIKVNDKITWKKKKINKPNRSRSEIEIEKRKEKKHLDYTMIGPL